MSSRFARLWRAGIDPPAFAALRLVGRGGCLFRFARLWRAGIDPRGQWSVIAHTADGWCLTGALAQLGEHLLCKQGVAGSSPAGSTNQ